MVPSFSPLVRALLDALAEGVVVFDTDGRVAYANPGGHRAIHQLANEDDPSGDLRSFLLQQGARIAPLVHNGSVLGEAAYLGPIPQGGGTLAAQERHAILQTLNATGWRLTQSAKQLGISRTTLWRRLKRYGLDRGARGRPPLRPF